MAHTPGPWFTDGTASDDCLDVNHHNGRVCMVDCANAQQPTEDDLAEAEANAHLIAAAPDLLAALAWAVEAADTEQYEADWYAAARVAIAKARGKAEANARLIAPDMLAALSDIILSSDANCGDSLANAIEAARNAIAKAKGE